MFKKFKHIRISEELFLKVKQIAITTFRSVGLTAEMLLSEIVTTFSKNNKEKDKKGGDSWLI